MILIGYSGHSYVINGIINSMGLKVTGYCDSMQKDYNPLGIKYHGSEDSASGLEAISETGFFISVGNNGLRRKIYSKLASKNLLPGNAVHRLSLIDPSVSISSYGVMIGGYVTVNALAKIGSGAICNSDCIIEHECVLGDFSHIGPGAILCGNVHVGENSLIGAGAIVREGIHIGANVIVGAGSIVVKDVGNNSKVIGNPARQIN